MRCRMAGVTAIALLLIGAGAACACNALVIDDGERVCMGRSLDAKFDDGWWVVCPRGVTKTGWVPHDGGFPVPTWTSEYGSVTLSAMHADLPLGGMNEAGFILEHLAVGAKFPPRDERPGLVQFQWMQYHLDTCGTVLEFLAQEPEVRMEGWVFEIIHLIACDATGAVAIVEYLPDGAGGSVRRVYTGDDIPDHMAALGNAPYQSHMDFMSRYQGFGGAEPVPSDRQALAGNTRAQFAWSADRVRRYAEAPTGDPVGYAFEALRKYTWDGTAVSVVHDTTERTIHWVSKRNAERRAIDLRELSFAPDAVAAFSWHDAVSDSTMTRDIDGLTGRMLEYFARTGAPEGFAKYTDELARYRAW